MNETKIEEHPVVREDITKSFRLMWDGFPYPVLLLRKNRMIVDSNQAARSLGVPDGVRCRDISPYPEKCKTSCLADVALASGSAERIISRQNGTFSATYWIPLNARDNDLYLHFVMDLPDSETREEATA